MSNERDREYEAAVVEFCALPETADLRRAYEERLLPLSYDRIRREARAPVDVLFLTVGKQSYSVELSLLASPAKEVVFLCTDDSQKNAERAASRVLAPSVPRRYERVTRAGSLDVYAKIGGVFQDIVRRGVSRPSVVVDITSGTKAMTAAASSAAMLIDADQRYVEGTIIRGEFRAHEAVHDLPHPLKEMGDLERREGERLFDGLAFDRAEEMFSRLHEKDAPGYLYDCRATISRAYRLADALEFGAAANTLDEATMRRLGSANRGDPVCGYRARIQEQRVALEELASGPRDETLMRFYCAYARRREEQRLFDVAALVHYRTIELSIQARLKRRGLADGNATREQYEAAAAAVGLSVEQLLAEFNRLAGRGHTVERLPDRIALAQGWTLLAAFKDELVEVVRLEKLLGRIRARNESVLAHGRKPITSTVFVDFKDTARQVREKAADLEGWILPAPGTDPVMDFVRLTGEGLPGPRPHQSHLAQAELPVPPSA